MPRITTGTAKNKKIKVPNIKGFRAPQDVMKLALFSIIGAEKVTGAKCLDLYAGSGSLGLEALSRGASWCDFVDEDKKSIKAILENIKNMGFKEKAEAIKHNSVKFVANTSDKYDLIFADPFYDDLKHKFLFQNLEEILENNGFIAFLHGRELDLQDQIENTNLEIITTRRFGKSYLSILD